MHAPQRLMIVIALAGIGLATTPIPASAAATVNDCTSHLADNQTGSLTLTSVPPAGSSVASGDKIILESTWSTPDWAEKQTILVCATTNGTWSAANSTLVPTVNETPSFTWPVIVPGNLADGTNLCLRQVLLGRLSDGTSASETSNEVCFRTAATAATTTTTTAPALSDETTSTTEPVVVPAGTPPPAELTEVAPADLAAPAPAPELPRTGTSLEFPLSIGTAAIIAGGLARRLGRRRPVNG